MSKRLWLSVLTLIVGLALVFSNFGVVLATSGGGKVKVCHATGSESNPYTLIEVSTSSVASKGAWFSNGHGSHEGDAWNSFHAKNGDFIAGQGNMGNCYPTATPH